MKTLNSFAFYALVTPMITFGAASVLAGQPTPSVTEDAQGTKGAHQSDMNRSSQSDMHRSSQSDMQKVTDRQNRQDQSHREHRGYLQASPTNGMQASDLIGADVKTKSDENVGPVNELIIDENGQVVAVVVGVGGFLGMGEKDVAIGWDDLTITGPADEQEFRIDVTRENLRSAPEYEMEE